MQGLVDRAVQIAEDHYLDERHYMPYAIPKSVTKGPLAYRSFRRASKKIGPMSKYFTEYKRSSSGPNARTSGFQGIEKKFVDAIGTNIAFTTGWAGLQPTSGITNSISVPSQGVGESQHLGRTYFINSIHVRGWLTKPAIQGSATPISTLRYRFVIVLDKQTNATAITGTDVMDAGAGIDTSSFRNLQNSHRFRILYDTGARMLIPQQAGSEGGGDFFFHTLTNVPFRINKTFKTPIKVRCENTTADVASVADNSISIIGLASDTALLMSYDTRCRFSETA